MSDMLQTGVVQVAVVQLQRSEVLLARKVIEDLRPLVAPASVKIERLNVCSECLENTD